ncbi:single-stranded DNA-binding protein [Micromonospora sp. NPDC093277]|uniref:single-stranded DNA-binding protein n=1 Tax=Micromonospora sp. NPDC093277 TaxID=3364291 RepID=UPI00381E1454
MFDTYVTIVGNVLTAPEWRRTTQSNTLVANFKVASTARRLDRDSGRWVDGNSLRVRVNCWRKLAEGVAASVMVGDPVVVVGRLYTRDWTDDAGNHRTLYELEAVAVGHDLSRGRGRFLRNRPGATTSTVEDAEAERRVHGEETESVPDAQAPATLDDRPFDDEFELPAFAARAGHELPEFAGRPGHELSGDPGGPAGDVLLGGSGGPAGEVDGLVDPFDEPAGDDDEGDDELAPEPDEGSGDGASAPEAGGVTSTGPGRRGRRRTPVPA